MDLPDDGRAMKEKDGNNKKKKRRNKWTGQTWGRRVRRRCRPRR